MKWAAVMMALLTASAVAQQGAAAPRRAGVITALLPKTQIVRGAGRQQQTLEARKGDVVYWGDQLRTDKGGRVRVTLDDQSILSLASASELRIVKHDARTQQTRLQLGYGRVRAQVTRITRADGGFTIKTPTAVAGVIGTDLTVSFDGADTEADVLDGRVGMSAGDAVGATPGDFEVVLTPGRSGRVGRGSSRVAQGLLTPSQLQSLIDSTAPDASAALPSITSVSPDNAVAIGRTTRIQVNGSHLQAVKKLLAAADGVVVAGVRLLCVDCQTGGVDDDRRMTLDVTPASGLPPGPIVLRLGSSAEQPLFGLLLLLTDGSAQPLAEEIRALRSAEVNLGETASFQAVDGSGARRTADWSVVREGGPATPLLSGRGPEFDAQTCQLSPGRYVVEAAFGSGRRSLVMTVLPPSYRGPGERAQELAEAYDARDYTAFISLFADAMPGYPQLSQNIKALFPKLRRAESHVRVLASNVRCNEVDLVLDWSVSYQYVGSASAWSAENKRVDLTMRRVPGEGWSIINWHDYGGVTQPSLPAPGPTSNADVALADLKPVAVGALVDGRLNPSALTATPGQIMKFAVQVNNVGSATLGAGEGSAVQTIFHLSGAGFLLASEPVTVLARDVAVGGGFLVSGSFDVPAGAPAGSQLSLSALVNSNGATPESDGSNDEIAVSVPVGRTDLRISALEAKAFYSGHASTGRVTVANLGAAPYVGAASALRVSGADFGSATTTVDLPFIAVGGVATVDFNFATPSVSLGAHPLTATLAPQAGDAGDVGKTLTNSIAVLAAYDLSLSQLSAVGDLFAGLGGELTLTVSNNGAFAYPGARQALRLSSADFAGFAALFDLPPLKAGESTRLTLNFTAPSAGVAASHVFAAAIAPAQADDSTTSPKTTSASLLLKLPSVDLRLQSFSCPTLIVAQKILCSVGVRNAGALAYGGDGGGVKLSGSDFGEVSATAPIPALAGGASASFNIAFTSPIIVYGAHDLTASIVAPNGDAGTLGKSLTSQVVTAPEFDLQPVSITMNAPMVSGQKASGVIVVGNRGPIDFPGQSRALRLVSANFAGYEARFDLPAIAAGGSVSAPVSFTAPTTGEAGQYAFTLSVVDVAGDANSSAQTLAGALLPVAAAYVDLKAGALVLSSASGLKSGDAASLQLTASNLGTQASTAGLSFSCSLVKKSESRVLAARGRASGGAGSSALLGVGSLPSIAAGATSSPVSLNYVIPANFYGDDQITCAIAADVNESPSTMGDNTASASLTIDPNIRLTLSETPSFNTSVAGAAQSGRRYVVSALVRNAGLDDSDADWGMRILVNGVQVGDMAGVAIAGGATAGPMQTPMQTPTLSSTTPLSANIEYVLHADGALREVSAADSARSDAATIYDFSVTPRLSSLRGVRGRSFDSGALTTISPSVYPFATTAVAYSATPAGLTGSSTAALGELSGAPSAVGETSVAVTLSGEGASRVSPNMDVVIRDEVSLALSGATPVLTIGAPTTMTLSVSGGGDNLRVTPTLPSGVTTGGELTQTPVNGLVSWTLTADATAAVGAQTMSFAVVDDGFSESSTPGKSSTFAIPYVYKATVKPSYAIVGGVAINSTNGATLSSKPPFTGDNAFQVGENVTFRLAVQNMGETSASGDLTISMQCPDVACLPETLTQTVSAPAAGQIVYVTLAAGAVELAQGAYNGQIRIATTIDQGDAAGNVYQMPFEVVDFNPWLGLASCGATIGKYDVLNIPVGGSATLPVTVDGVTGSASFEGPLMSVAIASTQTGLRFAAPPRAKSNGSVSVVINADNNPSLSGQEIPVNVQLTNQNVQRPVVPLQQMTHLYTAQFVFSDLSTNSATTPLIVPAMAAVRADKSIMVNWKWVADYYSGEGQYAQVEYSTDLTGLNISGPTQLCAGDNGVIQLNASGVAVNGSGLSGVVHVRVHIPNTYPEQIVDYPLYVRITAGVAMQVTRIDMYDAAGNQLGGDASFAIHDWIVGQTARIKVQMTNAGAGPSTGGRINVYYMDTLLSKGDGVLVSTLGYGAVGGGESIEADGDLLLPPAVRARYGETISTDYGNLRVEVVSNESTLDRFGGKGYWWNFFYVRDWGLRSDCDGSSEYSPMVVNLGVSGERASASRIVAPVGRRVGQNSLPPSSSNIMQLAAKLTNGRNSGASVDYDLPGYMTVSLKQVGGSGGFTAGFLRPGDDAAATPSSVFQLDASNGFATQIVVLPPADRSTLHNGSYFVLLRASSGNATRDFTVHIRVVGAVDGYSLTLTADSSAGSGFLSPAGQSPDGEIELSGPLPELVSLVADCDGSIASCAGVRNDLSVDFAFGDAPNAYFTAAAQLTSPSPGRSDQVVSAPVGQPLRMAVQPALSGDGEIVNNDRSLLTISLTNVQGALPSLRVGNRRIAHNESAAVGSMSWQVAVKVNDLYATSDSSCYSAPPGQSLDLSIYVSGDSGFAAKVTPAWKDASGADVGASLSYVALSGDYSQRVVGAGSDGGYTYSYKVSNTLTADTAAAAQVQGLTTLLFDLSFQSVSYDASYAAGMEAVKHFPISFDFSPNGQYCRGLAGVTARAASLRPEAQSFGPRKKIKGFYALRRVASSRRAALRPSAVRPDVQLLAGALQVLPSWARPGSTIEVRFKATNLGASVAQAPMLLQADGVTVDRVKLDVGAGASVMASLRYALPASAASAPKLSLVVDPAWLRETPQMSSDNKSLAVGVRLARLTPRLIAGDRRRLIMELGEGVCASVSFLSGASRSCSAGDATIQARELASGQLTIASARGVVDLGSGAQSFDAASAQWVDEASLAPGHSYAVRLADGGFGVIELRTLNNRRLVGDASQKVFRKLSGGRVLRGLGASAEPARPGELSGVAPAPPTVVLELVYGATSASAQ